MQNNFTKNLCLRRQFHTSRSNFHYSNQVIRQNIDSKYNPNITGVELSTVPSVSPDTNSILQDRVVLRKGKFITISKDIDTGNRACSIARG